ncbi:esterase-like activity of phytase family protein [Sphingomonas lutea]
MDGLSDRRELGARAVKIELAPVQLPATAGPLRVAGAWRLTGDDPRFGGISAMAIHEKALLAVTDSGAVVRFAKPAGKRVAAIITDVPDGPGDPQFKRARDAESLVRDPAGRGWWVGFENRHSLWLFDLRFERALARINLGRGIRDRNGGIEGMAADGEALLAFPERGNRVLRLLDGPVRQLPIVNPRGRITDAMMLGGGRVAVIERRWTVFGFRNRLGILEPSGAGFRYAAAVRLPVSPIDNVEALTAERLANGTIRFWMMTDDNYHAPMRTLLIAFDLPPQRPAS